MEMSLLGTKVIYPPTLQPIFKKSIPLRIKNTFNPSFEGTIVSPQSTNGNFIIKGVSFIGEISLLNFSGSCMVGVPGISCRLFGALARKNISIVLITQASSEHSICFAIMPENRKIAKLTIEEEFGFEMKTGTINPIDITENLSIIAIIGENIKHRPGISVMLFTTLGKNGINVVAIAQGSSELNLSVVIAKNDISKAINLVHNTFFSSQKRKLHIFLVCH